MSDIQTGEDLLTLFRDRDHRSRKCNACGEDLGKTGISRIVYTFEECSCDAAPYTHLIETMWHRDCFLDQRGRLRKEAKDV